MPRYIDWKGNDAHHKLLSAAMNSGRKSEAAAKALREDFAKIHSHAASIAETVLNKPSRAASKAAHGHEVLKGVREHAQKVFAHPPIGFDGSSKKRHHTQLNSMSAGFKRAADHAADLNRHLADVHSKLEAISELYKK
jgi:hypothetical protein